MDWKKILINLLGTALAAVGTALASGATPKTALALGAGAAAANGAGLFQEKPQT